MNKVYLSWDDIERLCRKIYNDEFQYDNYDCIVALGRGGMVPARLLSELMKIKNVYLFNISTYSEDDKLSETKTEPFAFENLRKGEGKILLVDDICTTGTTISEVEQQIRYTDYGGCYKCIDSYTLLRNKYMESKILPTYYSEEYDGSKDWIVFPWENLNCED